MAIDNFIPTIWTARILQNLHKSLVYGQAGVINRDYEGDITDVGDSVRINAIGAVAVSDYTKNSNMSAAETLDSGQTTLMIDQAKYFNFQVDDVDRVQSRPKVMDEAMREAGYALGDTLDQTLAGLWSQIDSNNYIATNAAPKTDLGTSGNPYGYLLDLMVLLDEDNVPKVGRWVVVPPWFHAEILKDDTFVGSGSLPAEARLMNGMAGQIAGFNVLVSNNVDSTSATASFKIIAGHSIAWTLAEQINRVEAYRPELRFADAVKGLHLYGAKVTRPSAMALLFASKP